MSVSCKGNCSHSKFSHFCYDQNNSLGSGASSSVYQGIDFSNNETVAVKTIELNTLKTPLQKLLLDQEINVLETLKNSNLKNIAHCRHINRCKDKINIVLDLCKGGNLSEMIKAGKLPVEKVKNFLKNIIEGYLQLNQKKIIHRDLKAQNILLQNNQEPLISDFGFSVIQEEEIKKYSYIVGSPGYLAPESMGQAKFGVKSDIWALGVLTYVMLEGKTPWKGKNQKDLLNRLNTVPIKNFIQGKDFGILNKFMITSLKVDVKQRMGIDELTKYLEELKIDLEAQSDEKYSRTNIQIQKQKINDIAMSKTKNSNKKKMKNSKNQRFNSLKQNRADFSLTKSIQNSPKFHTDFFSISLDERQDAMKKEEGSERKMIF